MYLYVVNRIIIYIDPDLNFQQQYRVTQTTNWPMCVVSYNSTSTHKQGYNFGFIADSRTVFVLLSSPIVLTEKLSSIVYGRFRNYITLGMKFSNWYLAGLVMFNVKLIP